MTDDGLDPLARYAVDETIGVSEWLVVDQSMIDQFGLATKDPDPMHIDPIWAKTNSPFGQTIAFGFLTASLLTALMYSASATTAARETTEEGYHLNYGFDRLRFIAPIPVDARIRGSFTMKRRVCDDRGRWISTVACRIDIEGFEKPALVADWLSMWAPSGA